MQPDEVKHGAYRSSAGRMAPPPPPPGTPPPRRHRAPQAPSNSRRASPCDSSGSFVRRSPPLASSQQKSHPSLVTPSSASTSMTYAPSPLASHRPRSAPSILAVDPPEQSPLMVSPNRRLYRDDYDDTTDEKKQEQESLVQESVTAEKHRRHVMFDEADDDSTIGFEPSNDLFFDTASEETAQPQREQPQKTPSDSGQEHWHASHHSSTTSLRLQKQLQILETENIRLQQALAQSQQTYTHLLETNGHPAQELVRALQVDKRQLRHQLEEPSLRRHEGASRDASMTPADGVAPQLEQWEVLMRDKEKVIQALQTLVQEKDAAMADLMQSTKKLHQGEGDEQEEACNAGKVPEEENEGLAQQLKQVREESSRWKAQVDELRSECDILRSRLEDSEGEIVEGRSKNTAAAVALDDVDQDVLSNTGTEISATPQMQIQERDKAIASLLQRSMEQEEVIADLSKQLAMAKEKIASFPVEKKTTSAPRGPSWEEVKELRREAEMFAEQVIEQDEEIETLTRALKSREERVAALETELGDLKNRLADASQVEGKNSDDLRVKIEEMEETNRQLEDEIQLLKKKQNELEEAGNEELRRKTDELKAEMEQFENRIKVLSKEKEELEKALDNERARKPIVDHLDEKLHLLETQLKQKEAKLKQKDAQLELLQCSAKNLPSDENEVESLKSELDSLKMELANQTSALDQAKAAIVELEREVALKDSSATTNLNEEKEELMLEVENLSHQLEESHAEVKTLSEIVDNYELKLRLIAQDKDATIDSLNRSLSAQKEDSANEISQLRREVEGTIAEMKRLKDEVSNEVSERDERIFVLQQALNAHKDLVDQMKTEMDHLQGSMESRAVSRREEIEEMQQELVDLTSTVAQQERQIKSLQGEIQDKQIEHAAEIEKWKKEKEMLEIANEQLGSKHRNALDIQMETRLKELKDRLDKMRLRNNAIQQENMELRRQLAKETLREDSFSTPSDEAMSQLQDDLNSQLQRVKELEAELEEFTQPAPKLEPSPSDCIMEATPPESPTESPAEAVVASAPTINTSASTLSSPLMNLSVRRQRGMGFLSRGKRQENKAQQ